MKLSDFLHAHDSAGFLGFPSDLNYRPKLSSTFCGEALLGAETEVEIEVETAGNSKEQSQAKNSKHAVIRQISKLRASQKDLLTEECSDDIPLKEKQNEKELRQAGNRKADKDKDLGMKFPLLDLEKKALCSSNQDASASALATANGHEDTVQQAYNSYNDYELTLALDSFSGNLN